MTSNKRKFNAWTVALVASFSFAAGLFVMARVERIEQVRAESTRVFELRVYHAVPGKLPALESRFRDTASKLLAKHNLDAVGYWVPEDPPASDNTFIYLLAHPGRDEAKRNWDALFADPAFQEIVKSEQADKLVEKVDSTFMRPTDFSPMK